MQEPTPPSRRPAVGRIASEHAPGRSPYRNQGRIPESNPGSILRSRSAPGSLSRAPAGTSSNQMRSDRAGKTRFDQRRAELHNQTPPDVPRGTSGLDRRNRAVERRARPSFRLHRQTLNHLGSRKNTPKPNRGSKQLRTPHTFYDTDLRDAWPKPQPDVQEKPDAWATRTDKVVVFAARWMTKSNPARCSTWNIEFRPLDAVQEPAPRIHRQASESQH